jgi:hypothetical protein
MAKKQTQTRGRQKEKRNVPQGIVHIQSTFNNTIVSVTETIVLLKVDWMCTIPWGTLRFSFWRPRVWACFLAIGYFFPFVRRTPTVRRGPLRMRAFVRVRWPRTGRPRRWRMPR